MSDNERNLNERPTENFEIPVPELEGDFSQCIMICGRNICLKPDFINLKAWAYSQTLLFSSTTLVYECKPKQSH